MSFSIPPTITSGGSGPNAAVTPATVLTPVSGQSRVLCAVNANRKVAIITNMSTTAILWVAFGGTAVIGSGVALAPAADATHPGAILTISGGDYTGIISGVVNDTTAIPVAEI